MQSQGTFGRCSGWPTQQLTVLPPQGTWRVVLALALLLLLLPLLLLLLLLLLLVVS